MAGLSKRVRDDWWDTVKRCLVELHGRSPRSAAAMCREEKKALKKLRIGDMLFHEEPFREAEHLAGNELNLSDNEYREKYLIPILGFTQEYFDQYPSKDGK
jgi:hypothetical protein